MKADFFVHRRAQLWCSLVVAGSFAPRTGLLGFVGEQVAVTDVSRGVQRWKLHYVLVGRTPGRAPWTGWFIDPSQFDKDSSGDNQKDQR